MAVAERDVKEPSIPLGIFIQEGEDLLTWSLSDKDVLTAKGLDPAIFTGLSVCLGALREAQSRWNTERNLQEEAAKAWSAKAPAAYDLRNTLIHDFRYAFRNDPSLLGAVNAIANGSGHADMIQDLSDLSVLGKHHTAQLAVIQSDAALLDQAASAAAELAELLATVNGNRFEHGEIKNIRDKAYTLCKNMVDEIRAAGQYVFWRNPERVKGYASAYFRRMNKQRGTAATETKE